MAQKKLYVGNLPYRTTEREVRSLFREYAPIHSVIIVAEKGTDRSLGYGFVELDEPKARCAICRLKNFYFNGRNLKVTAATGKDSKKKDKTGWNAGDQHGNVGAAQRADTGHADGNRAEKGAAGRGSPPAYAADKQ